jgi:hypothetical protein
VRPFFNDDRIGRRFSPGTCRALDGLSGAATASGGNRACHGVERAEQLAGQERITEHDCRENDEENHLRLCLHTLPHNALSKCNMHTSGSMARPDERNSMAGSGNREETVIRCGGAAWDQRRSA